MESLRLKRTLIKMKILLEGLNSRFEPTEDRINDFKKDRQRLCNLKNREKKE